MARICSDCGVRDSALCGSLDDAELVELGRLGVRRRLVRGDTLVRTGDPPLVCANLQSGVMKIASVTPAGTESIVGLLYPGDFIGRPYAGAADHDAADHDVVALTDVELCVFPRAAFEAALGDHRRMERMLLQRTLLELDRTRHWLMRLGRATAGARVAGFLNDMARRLAVNDCQRSLAVNDCQRSLAGNDYRRGYGGPAAGAAFDLPLSRGEIADLLGLTIETVSRQMTRLRAAGSIGLPGGRGIIVENPAGLAAAAEEFA